MQRYGKSGEIQKKRENFALFYNFSTKSFGNSGKSSTFAPAKRNKVVYLQRTLGYGVMVTLQILVLSFLVRVRVPQLKGSPIAFKSSGWTFSLAKLSSNYRFDSENSIFQKKLGMQLLSQQLHPLRYYKIAIIGNSVAKLRNYSEFRNFQSMISINCLRITFLYYNKSCFAANDSWKILLF